MTVLDLAGEGAQNKTVTSPRSGHGGHDEPPADRQPSGVGRVDVTSSHRRGPSGSSSGRGARDHPFDGDAAASRTARSPVARATSPRAAPADGARRRARCTSPSASPTGPSTPCAPFRGSGRADRLARRRRRSPCATPTAASPSSREGDATDVVAPRPTPPPPVLDTSQASVEEAHWPPPQHPDDLEVARAGEGEWVVPDVPWMRQVPGVAADAPSPFYRTFVRPDEDRPYAQVLLVAMDTAPARPRDGGGNRGSGAADGPPRTRPNPARPGDLPRVVAAFNGAFKTEHGHYGMMVHEARAPPAAAGRGDGHGPRRRPRRLRHVGHRQDVGGIDGMRRRRDRLVPPEPRPAHRPRPDQPDRSATSGATRSRARACRPSARASASRRAATSSTPGATTLSATALAKAMKMAGCDYAMHLDMNPHHTGFLFLAVDDLGRTEVQVAAAHAADVDPADRYIQYAPKDFFYVMVRDPTPPAVDGARRGGRTTERSRRPSWMPGLWTAELRQARRASQLLDIEPGRATWRIRAGAKDAPAAAPLRELAGDEARRVALRGSASASPTNDARSGSRPTDGSRCPCAAARSPGSSSWTPTGSSRWRARTPPRCSAPRRSRRAADRAVGRARWLVARWPSGRRRGGRRRSDETPGGPRCLVARGRLLERGARWPRRSRGGLHAAPSCSTEGLAPPAFLDRAGTSEPAARSLRRVGPLRGGRAAAAQRLPLRRVDSGQSRRAKAG